MFSERLRAKRQEKGLSQAELARMVGITRDLYNKYEKAGVRPSQETLVLLADRLGTTTDYLLSGRLDGEDDAPKPREVPDQVTLMGRDGTRMVIPVPPDKKEQLIKILDALDMLPDGGDGEDGQRGKEGGR